MKYNDGFIAYLNGTEVARRNAISTAWNADATSPRSDAASSVFEEINISQFIAPAAGGHEHSCHPRAKRHRLRRELPRRAGATSVRDCNRSCAISSTPTPGAQNDGGVVGFVGDTNFSHTRGFYTAPISVTITTPTPAPTIRYTLDGRTHCDNGYGLQRPDQRSAGTTILRAAAFLAGFQPSNIDTQTYFFLADIITQSEPRRRAGRRTGTINATTSTTEWTRTSSTIPPGVRRCRPR